MRWQYARKLVLACRECLADSNKGVWPGWFGFGLIGPLAEALPEKGFQIDTVGDGRTLMVERTSNKIIHFHKRDIPVIEIQFPS
jgi:hypothetical protein